ncbi:Zinc finger, CCHC-type [Sesbania bispinosa]|nr:Zinc finger, CCHC-type [Sesbania bispinosa]
MGKKLGAAMGTVLETHVYEVQERGSFVKALVEIDLKKPLLPGVNAGSKNDGLFWVDFQYEKIPQFCYGCGIVGHDEDDCSERNDRSNDEKSRGPWMRALNMGRISRMNSQQHPQGKPLEILAQEKGERRWLRT